MSLRRPPIVGLTAVSRLLIHPLLQSRQSFRVVNFGPGQRFGGAVTVFQNSVGETGSAPTDLMTQSGHASSSVPARFGQKRQTRTVRFYNRPVHAGGTAVAYFPPDLLKCVTFLGYKDQAGEFYFAGSAFWLSRAGPEDIKDQYRPAYLATAAHVIEETQKKGADNRVWMRVNTKGGSQESVETPLECWRTHTNKNVDIAVLKIGNGDYDHAAWPLEWCVFDDRLDTADSGDRRVELGDEICFAGLFHLHAGQQRNRPIVRVGTIAALREEPVLSEDGRPMDVYLVETRSFEGLSGSPVFIDVRTAKTTRPPTWGYMAAAYDPSSPGRFKLLGVVSGHFGDDVVAHDGKQKIHINMGIAWVIPAERIHQALTGYASQEEMEANEFRERKKARVLSVGDANVQQPNVTIGKVITTGSEPSKD
jgi:hypothetical protein